ncbi:acetate--CoA ligase family protein [uncultured Sulfitobacter sp.]|uniref:acetate--CoA ligase family protein n=1 Tax=uncultured Sulfitobacter sp. TaxID=191468 RepID=UPI0026095492|nr:acetate--CoA ligase family protein [uncultured Sulfitobacter sp.]
MSASLEAFLNPKSVAIIGASNVPARIGGRPINNLIGSGFKGNIYPINPKYSEVQGLPAFSSIADVPEVVDCAIVAVPVAHLLKTIRECADIGVRSVVVFTSGLAESGAEGAEIQEELTAIARDSGMRIVGPNCLGVAVPANDWYGTFANYPATGLMKSGSLGIISQSGAYGSHLYMMAQKRGLGVRYWVTTGNECDVDVAEVIEYYAGKPEVKVIISYAEGVQDMSAMKRALRAAHAARKPVIFIKVGQSSVGAAAAASHTASLAGSDALYNALFTQYGVYRALTTEEMLDVAYACQFGTFPKSRRICLQTISGGVGVLMADAAEAAGLEVPPLPDAVQKRISDLIAFAGTRNPVDFTGKALADPRLIEEITDLVIETGSCDSYLVYMASVASSPLTRDAVAEIYRRLREKHKTQNLILSIMATAEDQAHYENLGIPCFEDPSLAVRAIAALSYFGEAFEQVLPSEDSARPQDALDVPMGPVDEYQAKKVLQSWGIPVTDDHLVHTREEAAAAWSTIGDAAVMKVVAASILHKTEIGGVLLNIASAEAAADAFDTLIERARAAHPEVDEVAVLVGPMVSGGVETVLGVINDPLFGPAVMFGMGGVFVEVLQDVTFRLAPFDEVEGRRMIEEIRGRAILDGVRGAAGSDIDALARALSRLSIFAAENADRIESVDVNPFLLLPDGAVALDALIATKV